MIRVKPDTPYFSDASSPKPVIYIMTQTRNDVQGTQEPRWGTEQPNISFHQMIKGIDIDIRENPGAIGLRHTGSQGSSIENVRVLAEGAYAGFDNLCGQGGGTFGIEVIGGLYGIIVNKDARFVNAVGCRLIDQKIAALYVDSWFSVQLAGFYIRKNKAPVFELNNDNSNGLTLLDGVVELDNTGVLIRTRYRENVLLQNVYTNNVSHITPEDEDARPLNPEHWSHLTHYSYNMPRGKSYIDGRLTDDVIFTHTEDVPEPKAEEMIGDHLWDESTFPSFEDDDAVNIMELGAKGDGKTDDTRVFMDAIERHHKIFVPRGVYCLSQPLVLKPHTQLFGVSRLGSELRFLDADSDHDSALLRTPDHAASDCSISFLRITRSVAQTTRPYLIWQSGHNSILRNCQFGLYDRFSDKRDPNALAEIPAWIISGHGGGRWYTIIGRPAPGPPSPSYHVLLIDGSTEGLSLYQFNPEKSCNQIMVRNSRNVRFYYLKSEIRSRVTRGDTQSSSGTTIEFNNCDNCMLYDLTGNIKLVAGDSIVKVVNCENMLVSHVRPFSPSGAWDNIQVRNGSETWRLPSTEPLGVFRQAGFDHPD